LTRVKPVGSMLPMLPHQSFRILIPAGLRDYDYEALNFARH